MGEHRRKADGRRVFSTEFKRTAVQRILTGEKTVAGSSALLLSLYVVVGWQTILELAVGPHGAVDPLPLAGGVDVGPRHDLALQHERDESQVERCSWGRAPSSGKGRYVNRPFVPSMLLSGSDSGVGRRDNRDGLPLVAPVHPEVPSVDRDDAVPREELAHSDEAKVGEVRLSTGVAFREETELREVITTVERQRDQPVPEHRQDHGDALQMERGFGKHRLAREKRLGDILRHARGPFMVAIVAVGERDEEPRVGDRLHDCEKPPRVDKSFGPRTTPASRMKACCRLLVLAFSSWSRTIFPCGTPVFAAACSNHAASSFVRRTVIV